MSYPREDRKAKPVTSKGENLVSLLRERATKIDDYSTGLYLNLAAEEIEELLSRNTKKKRRGSKYV